MKTRHMAVAALLGTLAAGGLMAAEKQGPKSADERGLVSGYRAMALPQPGYALATVRKGDRLDVVVTFDAKMEDNAKEKVTATILQNVKVVDVRRPDKLTDTGDVEVLLNPNEAQYAALALRQGDVAILQRAPGDEKMPPMEMASFRKLFK